MFCRVPNEHFYPYRITKQVNRLKVITVSRLGEVKTHLLHTQGHGFLVSGPKCCSLQQLFTAENSERTWRSRSITEIWESFQNRGDITWLLSRSITGTHCLTCLRCNTGSVAAFWQVFLVLFFISFYHRTDQSHCTCFHPSLKIKLDTVFKNSKIFMTDIEHLCNPVKPFLDVESSSTGYANVNKGTLMVRSRGLQLFWLWTVKSSCSGQAFWPNRIRFRNFQSTPLTSLKKNSC